MRPIFLKIPETIVKKYKNRPRIGYATGRIFLGKHARAVTYPDRCKAAAVPHPHETAVQPVFRAQEAVTEAYSTPVYMAEAIPHWHVTVAYPVFHGKVEDSRVPASMAAAAPVFHAEEDNPDPA